MLNSGLVIDPEVKTEFAELRSKKISAIRFMVNPCKTKIVIDSGSKLSISKESPYMTTMEGFEDHNCKYAAVHVELKDSEKSLQNKLVFIMWVSDNAPVKERMITTASLGAIKSELNLNGITILQMNSLDDKKPDMVIKRLAGKRLITEFEGKSVTLNKETNTYDFTN